MITFQMYEYRGGKWLFTETITINLKRLILEV